MYLVHRCRCGSADSGRCAIGFRKVANQIRDWVMQARCDIGEEDSEFVVVVEFLKLRRTIEKKYSFTHETGCQPGRHEPVVPTSSDTSQKFLLAEFFADPRPDLFMVFGNAHDRMPLRRLVDDIDLFAKLIDQYVIRPTRLIWLSRIAEDDRRKPQKWREMRYENGTLSRLEWLAAANRVMYDRMRQRFLDEDRLLLFPDLLQMSESVLTDFNIDGVHMKPGWYSHVVSFILQSMCTGAQT